MSKLGPEKVSDNAERSAEQDANMASLLPVDVTAIPSVQIGIGLLPESSAEQEQEKGAHPVSQNAGSANETSEATDDAKGLIGDAAPSASPQRRRCCKARIFKMHATPMKTMIFYYSLTAALPTMDAATSTVAMPVIAQEYGIDISLTQWIMVAMNLGCAVSGTISGKFLERFGSINMFLCWALLATLSSLLSAFMPEFYSLLVMRFVTGVALTGMNVTKWYLFRLLPFPEKIKLGLFLTIFLFDLGAIVTPLVAGFVVEHMDWRICYVICALLSAITFFSMVFVDDPFTRAPKRKTDFGGIFLLSFAYIVSSLSASVLGQQAFLIGSALLLLGCLLFGLFIFLEKRIAHPLIPLGVLTGPLKPLLSIHLLITFYRNATRMLVPFIYSIIYGRSSVFVGVLNAVFGVMDILTATLLPVLDKRYTTRRIFSVCFITITICTAAFPFVTYNSLYPSVVLFVVAFAFLNVITSMAWAVILTTAPVSQLPVISALQNLSRTLACSVGTCIVSALHSIMLQGDYGALYPVAADPYYTRSYARATSVCMGVMFISIFLTMLICVLGLSNYEADRGKRGFSEKRLVTFKDEHS